jgi:hypothetical protein
MIPHDTHLQIGSLLFEGLDQIDLTGPFEILSRIPNSTYRIFGKTAEPVRDVRGLWLTFLSDRGQKSCRSSYIRRPFNCSVIVLRLPTAGSAGLYARRTRSHGSGR